jgi:hypothetical protein
VLRRHPHHVTRHLSLVVLVTRNASRATAPR